jgi:hypothetical protein
MFDPNNLPDLCFKQQLAEDQELEITLFKVLKAETWLSVFV